MRLHSLVARADMRRQGDGDRRGLAAFVAAAFKCQTNRIGMRHIAVECLDDGGVELARPIAFQQLDQRRGDVAQVIAALGGGGEQAAAGWRGLGQTIGRTVATCRTFRLDQCLDMRLDLDLRAKFNLYPGVRFLSDIEGTDTLTYKVAQVGGPAQEYVGTDSPFALNTSPGVSQYKAVWSNTLIVNKAEVSAIAHYQSGITLEGIDVAGYGVCLSGGPTGAPFPSNCHEHHFAYFDMTGMYHLTKDIDLTAAIENVLDTKPPLEPAVGAGTNYDPTFAMAGIVGRFFRAGVKYSFH